MSGCLGPLEPSTGPLSTLIPATTPWSCLNCCPRSGRGSGLASPPPRAICGVLSCAYLFCQRTFLGFVKTNPVTSKLLATRWAPGRGWGLSGGHPGTSGLLSPQPLHVGRPTPDYTPIFLMSPQTASPHPTHRRRFPHNTLPQPHSPLFLLTRPAAPPQNPDPMNHQSLPKPPSHRAPRLLLSPLFSLHPV